MTKKPARPRILAIDDNPENLVVIGTALESEFDIRLASSGPEGLDLARQCPPDLVLLDVMMPGVGGFETCQRFKQDESLSGIPVIFLTAVSDVGTEVAGLEIGAADYITKPIKVALLQQRVRNILQMTRLARELAASEERLRLVMEATGEGVWDWVMETGKVTHNTSWCRILGLDETFLEHPITGFLDLIHPEDHAQLQLALEECLAGGKDYESEHRLKHADGHYVWLRDRGRVVARDRKGNPTRMVGSIQNIDDRKRNEEEIYRLAFFDPLTGLPNRRLLLDRLMHSMIKNQRGKRMGALMFLDMDRFKLLNDTHGHAMGDALLIEVANRLRRCVREEDTVARIGGDEFVVLLESISGGQEDALERAAIVARKILETLNRPYELPGLAYASTPSIGLTLVLDKQDTVDDVLKRADHAMYEARAAGRNTYRVFMPEKCAGPLETPTEAQPLG